MADSDMVIKVREMILTGQLAPGSRVTEAGLADQLKVSRTPVRNVLPALAKEGLLVPVGRRGFAVKAFTAQESLTALDLRSVLEGFAARIVAQRGASAALRETMRACLADGDAIFRKRHLEPDDEAAYGNMNARFHSAIVSAAETGLINDMYERIKLVPFAAPVAIAFNRHGLEKAYELLLYAHGQHHAIVAAILAQDGARAEFLFREHSTTQRSSLTAK